MLRDRFRGALVGCLLGDAFGSVLEGIAISDSRLEQMVSRRRGERQPWRYTDDTEMARSLVAFGMLNGAHLMETWSDNYEPARGYGKGVKLALQAWRSGGNPAAAAWLEGSNGSGASVRVVGLACLLHRDAAALELAARESAALTHRGPIGMDGCVLYAQALARALRQPQAPSIDAATFVDTLPATGALGEKVRRIPRLLGASLQSVVSELGNGVLADESVPLSLLAFLRWLPEFDEVVVNAARCGGDVDTIAAMAGALAGAFLGASRLPRLWMENAEGVEEATRLADQLHGLWTARSPGSG